MVVLGVDGASADINLHGGTWVVQAAMDLAARAGFRIVEAGNIVPEAFDGATALEQEMLMALPFALTELAMTELLRQPEAWERLDRLDRDERVAEARAMGMDAGLWHLLHPPRVAIVGPPNVGKSTLANQLFGQERSITADLPGTTRDWVGEIANLDGLAVMLMDTPGIRETSDAIEAAAIEQAAGEVRAAELVVLVLEASNTPDPGMLPRFAGAMVVINKVDLAPTWDWAALGATEIMAKCGTGIDTLRERIRNHFGIDARRGAARWWDERTRRRCSPGA